jgi:hypothetical protein
MSNIRMPCDTSDQAHRTSSSHAGSDPCQQSFRISNPLRLLATLLQRKTTEPPFITSSLFQPTDYLLLLHLILAVLSFERSSTRRLFLFSRRSCSRHSAAASHV